jgi:hypothetical protein
VSILLTCALDIELKNPDNEFENIILIAKGEIHQQKNSVKSAVDW